MRSVNAAVCVVVIAAVFTASAVGHQASIDLPIEPVHLVTPMTLADAAQRNDFPAFAAIYAGSTPHEAASFAELHEFWMWSLTDPLGGFYGADVHARFAAEYPEYEAFIADFSIVDSNGNSFYPSAETRAFLLKQAIAGTTAKVASVRQPKAVARHQRTANANEDTAAPLRSAAHLRIATSVKTAAQHNSTAPETSAPVSTTTPLRAIVQPSTRVPLRTSQPATAPSVPARVNDARLARGFALMIAGLIGLGMLTLMLRTPVGEQSAEKPEYVDSMEPLRIIKLERAQQREEDSGSHSSVA